MIEITTGILMLVSAFSPAKAINAEAAGTTATSTATTTVTMTVAPIIDIAATSTATSTLPVGIAETEKFVREYFGQTPILAEIAKCESSFRHYDKDGNVLRGKVNDDDVGVMQINKYYHEDDAVKLGYDIYTLEGNLEYAKVLYGKYGARPWVHSSKCWGQTLPSHVAQA